MPGPLCFEYGGEGGILNSLENRFNIRWLGRRLTDLCTNEVYRHPRLKSRLSLLSRYILSLNSSPPPHTCIGDCLHKATYKKQKGRI